MERRADYGARRDGLCLVHDAGIRRRILTQGRDVPSGVLQLRQSRAVPVDFVRPRRRLFPRSLAAGRREAGRREREPSISSA